MLHCGAHLVTREQVNEAKTPAISGRWHPVAHDSLLDLVEKSLEGVGTRIVGRAHALSKEGQRYFGLIQVASPDSEDDEAGSIIGVRNSHDKSFPAAICCGSQVFVCDNLSFSGQVALARRHTLNIMRDLPHMTAKAIGKLGTMRMNHNRRVASYKDHGLTTTEAHDILVKAMDARAILPTKLPKVLAEYREPQHPEFKDRNLWSLYNAFTQVSKGSLLSLPGRSDAMHGVLDAHCGIALAD